MDVPTAIRGTAARPVLKDRMVKVQTTLVASTRNQSKCLKYLINQNNVLGAPLMNYSQCRHHVATRLHFSSRISAKAGLGLVERHALHFPE